MSGSPGSEAPELSVPTRHVRSHVVGLLLVELPALMLRVLWVALPEVRAHYEPGPRVVGVAELAGEISRSVRRHGDSLSRR